MGDASYALYLTHTIIIEIYRVGRNKLVGDQIAILDPKDSVYAMGAMLVICSLIAVVVHTRIELPILRWLRRKFVARPDLSIRRPKPDAPPCVTCRSES